MRDIFYLYGHQILFNTDMSFAGKIFLGSVYIPVYNLSKNHLSFLGSQKLTKRSTFLSMFFDNIHLSEKSVLQ